MIDRFSHRHRVESRMHSTNVKQPECLHCVLAGESLDGIGREDIAIAIRYLKTQFYRPLCLN